MRIHGVVHIAARQPVAAARDGAGAPKTPERNASKVVTSETQSHRPADVVEISAQAKATEQQTERVGLLPQLVVRMTGRLRAAFLEHPEVPTISDPEVASDAERAGEPVTGEASLSDPRGDAPPRAGLEAPLPATERSASAPSRER